MTTFSQVRCGVPAALFLGLLLAGCSKDDERVPTTPTPDIVAFTRAGLYPEGVEYDAAGGRFLVSSQTAGAVGQVKDDGTYAVFADSPALVSTIGMRLDKGGSRDRLLVAVSDPGYNAQRTSAATLRKLARLVIFNRSQPQAAPVVVDLGALRPALNHFANDIAVDPQGNAYITDSFAPIIYKVDGQTNAVTILLEDAQLGAPAGMFGLNGIVYHPNGYLLVARSDVGRLYKVPLSNPAGFTAVATTQNLQGADGLLLGTDANTLQVVTNGQAKVYRLATTDGWGSATVSGTFSTPPQYPTTLARRPGSAGPDESYVLYSNLNALQASQNPPVSLFTIAKVKF